MKKFFFHGGRDDNNFIRTVLSRLNHTPYTNFPGKTILFSKLVSFKQFVKRADSGDIRCLHGSDRLEFSKIIILIY